MRGVAALWVALHHVWASCGAEGLNLGLGAGDTVLHALFRAGLMGVALFFVLSGFVIAWPYVIQGRDRLSAAETADFYQRRFFRIAPVYYVSIGVALILGACGLLNIAPDAKTVLLHVLFLQSFSEEAGAAIRTVYWTLPVEMAFYLFFPLLLPRLDIRRPWRFALAAIAFSIAYRTAVWWLSGEGVWLLWTHAHLLGRIDHFVLGIAAACAVAASATHAAPGSGKTVIVSMLMAILASIAAVHPTAPAQWTYILAPSVVAVAIAAMLYAMGVFFSATDARERPPLRIPGARLLYWVGLASLSLYIWHTFFIDMAVLAADRWSLARPERIALIVAALPASIVLSFATYRLVEKPFVDLSKRPAWRRRILSLVLPSHREAAAGPVTK
jgi:peptidoglycan/LPS O-acetylase OafA/YrhL